jgi:CheY-like chemotaxis protein
MAVPALSGTRVLLVEDDRDCAEVVAIVLEHAGANVVTVPSGAAAIVQAAMFDPQVVLCDIAMPQMDGYQLLRDLRAIGHRFPVVAISAHAQARRMEEAHSLGFAAYLVKPLEPPTLVATVREVVDRA